MPYGFNEDRSKYELQSGGGGVQPYQIDAALPDSPFPFLQADRSDVIRINNHAPVFLFRMHHAWEQYIRFVEVRHRVFASDV